MKRQGTRDGTVAWLTLLFMLLSFCVYPMSPALADEGEVQLFNNGNIGVVNNGPTSPTVFTLENPCQITTITNYHWNNGLGVTPGAIGLLDSKGTSLGNWTATSRSGQDGAPNVYWDVHPDIVLEPGTYTIDDSDAATWSQNAESSGSGFSEVYGIPVVSGGGGGGIPPDIQAPTWPAESSLTAILNASGDAVDLSWQAAEDNVAVTGYNICRDDDGILVNVAHLDATTFSYSISGLSPNTTYTYLVKAIDAINNVSEPLTVTITTPAMTSGGDAIAPVTNLQATSMDTDLVNSGGVVNVVSWTDSATSGVEEYTVFKGTVNDIDQATNSWKINPAVQTITDNDVISGQTYYYFVRAYLGSNASAVVSVQVATISDSNTSQPTGPVKAWLSTDGYESGTFGSTSSVRASVAKGYLKVGVNVENTAFTDATYTIEYPGNVVYDPTFYDPERQDMTTRTITYANSGRGDGWRKATVTIKGVFNIAPYDFNNFDPADPSANPTLFSLQFSPAGEGTLPLALFANAYPGIVTSNLQLSNQGSPLSYDRKEANDEPVLFTFTDKESVHYFYDYCTKQILSNGKIYAIFNDSTRQDMGIAADPYGGYFFNSVTGATAYTIEIPGYDPENPQSYHTVSGISPSILGVFPHMLASTTNNVQFTVNRPGIGQSFVAEDFNAEVYYYDENWKIHDTGKTVTFQSGDNIDQIKMTVIGGLSPVSQSLYQEYDIFVYKKTQLLGRGFVMIGQETGQTDASINPVEVSYNKSTPGQADGNISVNITWNHATAVSDVQLNGYSIGADKYSVSDNILTLTRAYLQTLTKDQNCDFVVQFDTGNSAGLRVNVSDSVLDNAKEITGFSFAGLTPAVAGTITGDTITATVPAGTNVTSLVPTIAFSPNATVTPASGATQNFTSPVTYTVTAQDDTAHTYTVIVTVATAAGQGPSLQNATLDSTNKILTLVFDKSLTTSVADLKSVITFAADGTNFIALGANDSASINVADPKKLIVTFNSPLTGANNKLQIAPNTLKDSTGNVLQTAVTTLKFAAFDECFIATAAYGSKNQTDVVLLRQFRDQFLLTNSIGKSFVQTYYHYSPPIAQTIAGNVLLKFVTRVFLLPLVVIVYTLINPVVFVGMLLAVMFLLVQWRRRKAALGLKVKGELE